MAYRDEITSYLDSYLNLTSYQDASWNGLQVEGKDQVERLVVGVSAGMELFEKAAEANADYIIVHHGLFWAYGNPSYTGWRKKRIDILQNNNISLYAAHLPLDAHKEVGNNAQLLRTIEADILEEFLEEDGTAISYISEYATPKSIQAIEKTLQETISASCITLLFGPKEIRRVAVCTGGGGYKAFFAALDAKADLLITGDTAEIYNDAKDAGMHVIFAGHHATETLGVQALAKHLQKQFSLETEYIDIPTGL